MTKSLEHEMQVKGTGSSCVLMLRTIIMQGLTLAAIIAAENRLNARDHLNS